MEQSDKPFYRILNELCEELNINVENHSFGWVKIFHKDEKKAMLVSGRLNLNSSTSVEIANDKYACFEVLNANNIPIIEHNMIFNPKTRSHYFSSSDLERAKKIFKKYNNKIVIKANNSSQGKEVFLIEEEENIKSTIEGIFERNNDSLSICPFEEIKNEYRIIVLDGECLFSYKKEKNCIVGDGVKTIGQFINELDISVPNEKLDLNYIPLKDEKVELNWKFNLSGGAVARIIDNENLKLELEKIALKSANTIGIRFASVDVIENQNNELKVMEINANVCMNKFTMYYPNGYEIAKEIYKKALLKSFE